MIVSSYEADARIYATRTGVRTLRGDVRKVIDLLTGMPCDAFNILCMFHKHPHTLKVGVRLD